VSEEPTVGIFDLHLSFQQAPGQLWRLRRLIGSNRGPLNADVRAQIVKSLL